MKKESYLNQADVLYESIIPAQRGIRKKSEKYLQMALAEHGGSIDFNDYDPEEFVSVPYDGGNHPEYASNAFSVVNGVFINRRGVISLNTEDCSDYELEDVSWEEVYDLAEYLKDEVFEEK
jgi:hypothetical protein